MRTNNLTHITMMDYRSKADRSVKYLPFGRTMRYDGYAADYITKVPNSPFRATLRLDGIIRGRSALNFRLIDDTQDIEYLGGGKCFELMLAQGIVDNSVTALWWCFKRGQSQLIEPVMTCDIPAKYRIE